MFSLIIPTCHRNDDLALCLDHVKVAIDQLSGEPCEVIVTDDGQASTAEQMISERFPWVRWSKGPGRGPAANRNHGASLAEGDWLVFTDDDCLPEPQWLAAFAAHAQAATLLEGRTICRQGLASAAYEAPINERGGCLWSCNFAIRRDTFMHVRGFDERFPFAAGEDEVFRELLRASGLTAVFVPDAVVDHPPRLRPFGTKWNNRWKSLVLKEHLLQKRVWTDGLMPLRVAKSRLLELKSACSIRELVWLVSSAAIEVFSVAFYYQAWRRWALSNQAPELSSSRMSGETQRHE